MPEVTGLSLRKGLQRLNRSRLKIIIKGNGRIVGQSIKAGQSLTENEECILTLQPDR
jgi:cell division protein FtsI (penicillin-binding protein 3)